MQAQTPSSIHTSLRVSFSLIKTTVFKVPGTLLALGLFYVLPLALRIDLLWTINMLIPVLACAIIFMTQRSATKAQLADRHDRHSMKYLSIATLISQMSVVAEWAYWGENHRLLWNQATIVGTVMIGTGLFIRLWAIWTLGPYFQNTIIVVSNHQLVQKGIYKYIRHGSYTGALLTAVGIGIYLSAWVGVFVSVMVLGWAYRYRILHEEKTLIVHFGQRYLTYQQQTWMLFPFIL